MGGGEKDTEIAVCFFKRDKPPLSLCQASEILSGLNID